MQTLNRVFGERVISHGYGHFLLLTLLCVISSFGGIQKIKFLNESTHKRKTQRKHLTWSVSYIQRTTGSDPESDSEVWGIYLNQQRTFSASSVMQVYKLHYKIYCTFTRAAAEKAGNAVFVHKRKASTHPANNLPAFNLSTSSTCNIHLSNTYTEVFCCLWHKCKDYTHIPCFWQ
jgi:hypothetical protein